MIYQQHFLILILLRIYNWFYILVHGSSISLVSTASSLYSSAEEKQAHEIRKLRRELGEAQEKVHTLTSQLSTNVSTFFMRVLSVIFAKIYLGIIVCLLVKPQLIDLNNYITVSYIVKDEWINNEYKKNMHKEILHWLLDSLILKQCCKNIYATNFLDGSICNHMPKKVTSLCFPILNLLRIQMRLYYKIY